MKRVKIFYAHNDSGNLERNINEWLESMDGKIEITSALQDVSSGPTYLYVIITVFYKTK